MPHPTMKTREPSTSVSETAIDSSVSNSDTVTSTQRKKVGLNPSKKKVKQKAPLLPRLSDGLVSDPSTLKAFRSALKDSPATRPFVVYPPSARGDMNAFKYIQYLPVEKRPLVLFEYHKTGGYEQESQNENIKVFRQHLGDSRLIEGEDYIFADVQTRVNLKKQVGGDRKARHYKEFDNIFSNDETLVAAQSSLRNMASTDDAIITYLKAKHVDSSDKIRRNHLIMVNINKRNTVGNKWDPREMRHATDLEVTTGILEVALTVPINEEKEICVVGSSFTDKEKANWLGFANDHKVNIHFLNDMIGEGLNRSQQRGAQFAFADKYRSTTYFGHQSGVNEDAVVLPRTNVISMSEYLGHGQPGIGRVEARTQLDQIGPCKGIFGGAEPREINNFYSLRENEFLSTDGILAAVQVKKALKKNDHRSLDEIWTDIDEDSLSGGEEAIARKMYDIIFNDPQSDEPESTNAPKPGDASLYLDALRVIARRRRGDAELSEPVKSRLANVLEIIMQPLGNPEPASRRKAIDTARDEGRLPYTLPDDQQEHRDNQIEENLIELLESVQGLLNS